jgi:hypothetical protein
VDGDPLEVVDDDRDAGDALRLGEKAHDLVRFQMMQEQAAGDDIDARVGKWEVEGIARHDLRRSEGWRPCVRVWKMLCVTIEQSDICESSQSQESCPQHLCLSAGDLQDMRPLCARHPHESASEQARVQPVSTETTIHKPHRAQRQFDLLRRAVLLVQPLFFNKSFHKAIAIRDSDNPMT